MTDITELAQLRGRTVYYPYYLVECDCGKIYPSRELSGGEPMGDSGDYSDCYCPHCGEGEEHFAECADPETAWKAQQDKIDALVEALESKERTIQVLESSYNEQTEALEKAQRANEYLREQSSEWERKAISNFEDCAEMSARIEELESQRKLAFAASNRWADKFREAEQRIAELESRTVTVKLPNQTEFDDPLSAYEAIEKCKDALGAAGFKLEAE
ncbi:TPA: hypothetical protein MYN30_001092 [Klebsiella variicola subsp. variicola]|nr:hypothetical protein [Klebsiella variicola subsp. variicola]